MPVQATIILCHLSKGLNVLLSHIQHACCSQLTLAKGGWVERGMKTERVMEARKFMPRVDGKR
jgi:hypothetical protein